MAGPHCAFTGRNFSLDPEDIFALCDGSICVNAAENRAATADLSVVDDNKPTQIRNAIVVVDNKRSAGLNRESANLVSLELFAPTCHAGGRRGDRNRVALSLNGR